MNAEAPPSNEQHLLRVVDACIEQAKAPLLDKIKQLTEERDAWSRQALALRSGWYQTQAKIRALLTGPVDFRGLIQKIQALTETGALSEKQVNDALAGVGLKPEEMAQLINNAPLIAGVDAAIDAVFAANVVNVVTTAPSITRHACAYCGERFDLKHQQIAHLRLGHNVYCDKHSYGMNAARPPHKGISIQKYITQGWTIEQLRADGYKG
jgi:hypothetical protein